MPYMAFKKQGSITTIIAIAARLVPALSLSKRKVAVPKKRHSKTKICRRQIESDFVLTLDKSLGTGTYAKKNLLSVGLLSG